MTFNILGFISVLFVIGQILAQVAVRRQMIIEPAENAEFPFQVSIQQRDIDDYIIHVCGGSIINQFHVLTASHCVYRKNMEDHLIVAGTRDITATTDPNRVSLNIEKAYLHPNFDHLFYLNDIALLRVSSGFPTNNPFIRPISLSKNSPMEEHMCVATGWGESNTKMNFLEKEHYGLLHKQMLPRFNQEKCELLYLTQYKGFIKPGMMCMGDFGASPFCPSDGGGPLTCRGKLAGLYSYFHPDLPEVFANVVYFRTWISKTMARSYKEKQKNDTLSLKHASLTEDSNNAKRDIRTETKYEL